MADVPDVPSAEELSALPASELAARLAEAYRVIGELTMQVGRLSAEVEDLRRVATRPDLDGFTNNEAERTHRPVKVQRRSSGGCWRTLEGLTGFAMVQSYLSTAGK